MKKKQREEKESYNNDKGAGARNSFVAQSKKPKKCNQEAKTTLNKGNKGVFASFLGGFFGVFGMLCLAVNDDGEMVRFSLSGGEKGMLVSFWILVFFFFFSIFFSSCCSCCCNCFFFVFFFFFFF